MTSLWYCPSCHLEERLPRAVANRWHHCPSFGGLTTPLLPDGVRAAHELRYREDYVGSDHPQTDGTGRPVMSIVTTRDNGQDVTVFAPTATVRGRANEA